MTHKSEDPAIYCMKRVERMKIRIVLQFPNFGKEAEVWAVSERHVDFFNDPEAAARCTVAFAAVELKNYLSQCLIDADIAIREAEPEDEYTIRLFAKDLRIRGESYALIPEGNTLTIEGEGRVGVLYGAYELLKMQGIFWHEPGVVGTYIPEPKETLTLPEDTLRFSTPSRMGRGFSLDGQLNESEELALWMAHNRLNVYASRPNTHAIMHKLGFVLREGGHIFETILDPDRAMGSGKTIWEAHPEWYGTSETLEKTKENALKTQFCVSDPALLDYLSEELLSHIMDEWRDADEISVWGFDTWGGVCRCEKCRKLGNGTDQTLRMASHFREYLNRARKEKRLDRDVKMVLCAYEGTGTLLPPEKPVPQNLIDAGDYWLYATIVRCYAHPFGDPNCSYNREYAEILRQWGRLEKTLPMVVLEYYNVSKFEDLPLLFSRSMEADFPFYVKNGISGFNYMHIPMVNWGVRALTQVLFAELSWDPERPVEPLIEEYFEKRYGPYREEMKEIYRELEKAAEHITSWRAWKDKSLLSRLMEWDGGIPRKPLEVDDHFGTPENFETMGEASLALVQDALKRMETVVRFPPRHALRRGYRRA